MKKLLNLMLIALAFTACSIDNSQTDPDQPQTDPDQPGTDPEKLQGTVKTIQFYKTPGEWENGLGINEPYLSQQYDLDYDAEGRIAQLVLIDVDVETYPNGGGAELKKYTEIVPFSYKKQEDGSLMIEIMPVSNPGTPDQYNNDKEYLYCDQTGKTVKAKYISSDEESAPGSSDKCDYNYEYNAQDQLVKTISTQENKYDSFAWSNDNMTSYKTSIYEPISGNITYSGTQNNANIDLAYFVCFFNSTESLAFPHGVERGTLSGFFGKRTANMPETIVEGSDKLTYEYKVNAEGYVYEVLITDSYDSSETTVVIEYMN